MYHGLQLWKGSQFKEIKNGIKNVDLIFQEHGMLGSWQAAYILGRVTVYSLEIGDFRYRELDYEFLAWGKGIYCLGIGNFKSHDTVVLVSLF
jgi:hypothetical protein